ncbi:MAG: hypothetical protein ACRBFS_11990 [Aureispira sp.]
MTKLFLVVSFLFYVTLLNAQQVKQEISWGQYINARGEMESYKYTINFDTKGKKTTECFQGEDILDWKRKTMDYTYDALGRIKQVIDYNEHGETFGGITYSYQNNYYKKQEFSMYGREKTLTYFYVDKDLNIVEEKAYEIKTVEEGGTKTTLVKWVLFTYDKEGRLIGERYKSAQAKELYKRKYHYKKATKQLLRIADFYWDANKKEEVSFIEQQGTTFAYDEQGRLLKKHVQEPLTETLFSYQYKDGHLWIEEEYTQHPFKQVKKIYKAGILVREKFYSEEPSSKKGVHLLKEDGLKEVIDYQYVYE